MIETEDLSSRYITVDKLGLIETKDFPFYWKIKLFDKGRCIWCGGHLVKIKKPVECLKCMRCEKRYKL